MGLQLHHIEFQTENFPHYYLCNYQPRYAGNDELSKSLLRFKMCNKVDVEAWTECAIQELKKVKFKSDLLIIRAAGSHETTLSYEHHTALDWLGKKLADNFGGNYFPDVLSKSQKTRSIKTLSRIEREIELSNVYSFRKGISCDEVLILDDILTTGTTVKEIIRAIKNSGLRCPVKVFTLADTNHQAILNYNIELTGTSFTWKQEEWQRVAETDEYYNEYNILKTKILKDSFNN